jgi:hypothetical protein
MGRAPHFPVKGSERRGVPPLTFSRGRELISSRDGEDVIWKKPVCTMVFQVRFLNQRHSI